MGIIFGMHLVSFMPCPFDYHWFLCFFSVSFSNYPEMSFENTSLTFPSVIRTNFSATNLIRWNMSEEIKEEISRVKCSISDEQETFFLM